METRSKESMQRSHSATQLEGDERQAIADAGTLKRSVSQDSGTPWATKCKASLQQNQLPSDVLLGADTHALTTANVRLMVSTNMRSYAVLKASPAASKCMHVELHVRDGVLRIAMLQKHGGAVQAFDVVHLKVSELFVCWKWKHDDAFVICVEEQGRMCADIWCFVATQLRNKWLAMLQQQGAKVLHISALQVHNAVYAVEEEKCEQHRERSAVSSYVLWLVLVALVLGCVFGFLTAR